MRFNLSAGQAVVESAETGTIVHIRHSPGDHEYLKGAAWEWTDAGEDEHGHAVTEYWGTCEDGRTKWRVHTHGKAAHCA